MSQTDQPTACVLLIGNEILSGKTQDANLKFLGAELGKLGIKLVEARVIRDEHDMIIEHINECRAKYDYVFTTGGIGPTHDDITTESVARAFGVPLQVNDEAVDRLKRGTAELNAARLKMATVPAGASLIDNSISNAPGFKMDNVFVLAGIPSIARAMFAAAIAQLNVGSPIHSASIDVFAREGDIAEPLEHIANAHPDVEIGSYPFARDGRFGANLVVRGTQRELVEQVLDEIVAASVKMGAATKRPAGSDQR